MGVKFDPNIKKETIMIDKNGNTITQPGISNMGDLRAGGLSTNPAGVGANGIGETEKKA